MALAHFHTAVSGWLTDTFGSATEVQTRAWSALQSGQHALIAAPTGSGKTLAAFLSAINDLVESSQAAPLEDGVQVLYISPLKALSNDINRNLEAPLAGIADRLLESGLPDTGIRSGVRTGDTPQAERVRQRKAPPQILVTTPESLYILLTSKSGREMLSSVKNVIVDELHAVAGNKRGAHLLLSLERLEALVAKPITRIGLSATQKPIERMAEYLLGAAASSCQIIDAGHSRDRDLALEVPLAPLETVMSNEVWEEVYDRLTNLIVAHRTTLIFVNQRRVAERMAKHLGERLGKEHVTAHHGSLAKEHRLDAEQRLKAGQLKALVATASLELGIDIGDIDLVCQIGSPGSIAAFLQRVGRAGHAVDGTPKGRLFPTSEEDLVECVALLRAVDLGELDQIIFRPAPLDVLAQQIVGEIACEEWSADELFEHFRRADPYRLLEREEFDAVLTMLADGYSTRRGRRGAYLHWDRVNGVLRARKGAGLTALTNAGVIPDQFDYDVQLMPEDLRIGTLNEDFAFESVPGDIFQLGNRSYRVLRVLTGKVLVEDADGLPPNLPFWFGERPGRTDELSLAVSQLREDFATDVPLFEHLPSAASQQLTRYLAAGQAAFGALPTQDRIVIERFFDDTGDAHLVIHAPYGSRVMRAWGLALRKRFCRKFNFELQASALEDALILSLGPTHSFPLEEIKNYLKADTVREVLIQALLDAPMFNARWRWDATIALAIKRMIAGKKAPPQFQRSDAEDLLAVIFPDQLACQENLSGKREVPEHPLVEQAINDCLHETMDIAGLEAIFRRMEAGDIEVVTCDLTGPSPLAGAVLNARPYAFLDDGAAEERRTHNVRQQRLMEPETAADLGRLSPAAITKVLEEVRPLPATPDELHDALFVHAFFTDAEIEPYRGLLAALETDNRVASIVAKGGQRLWVTAERAHEFADLDEAENLIEIVRSRLELLGPITVAELAAPLGLAGADIELALLALENEGFVMQGDFTTAQQWCERRILVRINRYSVHAKRDATKPVSPAAFMRYLLDWHQLGLDKRSGDSGLRAALAQLEGWATPAGAWERELLAGRIEDYTGDMLDKLCGSGVIGWSRAAQKGQAASKKSGPIKSTPIVLGGRDNLGLWTRPISAESEKPALSSKAEKVLACLQEFGASFFDELSSDTGLIRTELEDALGELVSQGLISCDSFAGLRALIRPQKATGSRIRRRAAQLEVAQAGRWAIQRPRRATDNDQAKLEQIAMMLLRRYGVVFRKLLERETNLPPWRELHYVYRRMEARGEIRGGRFVTGFAGEQFALPEAVGALRKQENASSDELTVIAATDPLNLAGVILPGERVPSLAGNRLLIRNGVVVAVQTGGKVEHFTVVDAGTQWDWDNLLIRSQRAESYRSSTGMH